MSVLVTVVSKQAAWAEPASGAGVGAAALYSTQHRQLSEQQRIPVGEDQKHLPVSVEPEGVVQAPGDPEMRGGDWDPRPSYQRSSS